MSRTPHPLSAPPRRRRGWRALAAALLLVGAAARLAPLLDGRRLLTQFPTEDGYLMLTIARNLALGKGMSVEDGLTPTNGTQPLATFLWAAAFWIAEGDKRTGVAMVLALEVVIACAAAWALQRLGAHALRGRPDAEAAAALGAAAWFASPVVLPHTMNGLETGLYALLVVICCRASDALGSDRGRALRLLGLGALLGLAFWARNDAVFAALAVGGLHLAGVGLAEAPRRLTQRAAEVAAVAAVALAVAAPWLWHNLSAFGHLVPVSGRAESHGAALGENLARIPVALAEYLTHFLPVPAHLEAHPAAVAACTALCLVATLGLALAWRRARAAERRLLAFGALYALGLCGFYGVFFGAGHFVSRYLMPLSPLIALAWGVVALQAFGRARAGAPRLAQLAPLLLVLLATGLHVRFYRLGADHLHFEAKRWVERHVPAEVWVGAVQTGALGYFHDRTVNLDGKVSLAGFEARRQGRIPQYLLEREVEYIADWAGLAAWASDPLIGAHFELVRHDPARNLAVLQRRRDGGTSAATLPRTPRG